MGATKNENLIYNGSVTSSYNGNPILGRLEGPCADIIHPTRNGRLYSDQLWEKVFNSDVVKEYFACGGIFGELGHPADRAETDMEKICVCMPRPPVRGEDGRLIGQWDILNTPNGRILKCLCDYGFKMGVSSRGTGDVINGFDGQESVDPDTYQFEAFDIVLLPAVKSARLRLMKESVGNKTLQQALTESLEASSEEARKIMSETLDRLDIGYTASNGEDIQPGEDDGRAGNTGLVEQLQQALREQVELRKRVSVLNEQLSACNARERASREELGRYKSAAAHLSEQVRKVHGASTRITELEKALSDKESRVAELTKEVTRLTEGIQHRVDSRCDLLTESLRKEEVRVCKLQEQVSALSKSRDELHQQLLESNHSAEAKQAALTEQFEGAKKDHAIKVKALKEKLATLT